MIIEEAGRKWLSDRKANSRFNDELSRLANISAWSLWILLECPTTLCRWMSKAADSIINLIKCQTERFLIFSNLRLVVTGDVTRLKVSMQHCESV